MEPTNILTKILQRKQEEVAERKQHKSLADLLELAKAQEAPRGFSAADIDFLQGADRYLQ